MKNKKRRLIGLLTIGCLFGAAMGWLSVDEWGRRHVTDRYWREPGRLEAWFVFGTVLGAVVGSVIGGASEVMFFKWTKIRGGSRRRKDGHYGHD